MSEPHDELAVPAEQASAEVEIAAHEHHILFDRVSDVNGKVRLLWGQHRSLPMSPEAADAIQAEAFMSGWIPNHEMWVSPLAHDRHPMISERPEAVEKLIVGIVLVTFTLPFVVTLMTVAEDITGHRETIAQLLTWFIYAMSLRNLNRLYYRKARPFATRVVPDIAVEIDETLERSSHPAIQKMHVLNREPLVSIEAVEKSYDEEFYAQHDLKADAAFARLRTIHQGLREYDIMPPSDINDLIRRMGTKLLHIQQAETVIEHADDAQRAALDRIRMQFDTECTEVEQLIAQARTTHEQEARSNATLDAREAAEQALAHAASITLDTQALDDARREVEVRQALHDDAQLFEL